MKARLRRLVRGQTCRVCGRRRRLRWYSDTGACTFPCVQRGVADVQLSRPLARYQRSDFGLPPRPPEGRRVT